MESIFKKYESHNHFEGSDKNTGHSYIPVYESIFSDRKDTQIRLVEIGVCTGASIVAWKEYFTHPDSEILGIDITDQFLKYKINFLIKNGCLKSDVDSIPGEFDIIIDDGSHYIKDQITSIVLWHKKLVKNGLYIIEDIQSHDDVQVLLDIGTVLGLKGKVYDLRHLKNRFDDIMIVFSTGMNKD